MTSQDRYSKLMYALGGSGSTMVAGDGYINALNLWQGAPADLGETDDVAYFVEIVCLTVTGSVSYYGTGSTRRLAGFALKGGVLSLISQTNVEFLGGQVYPVFHADNSGAQPNIQLQFRLTNTAGNYFHTRVWINIIAHEPGVLP